MAYAISVCQWEGILSNAYSILATNRANGKHINCARKLLHQDFLDCRQLFIRCQARRIRVGGCAPLVAAEEPADTPAQHGRDAGRVIRTRRLFTPAADRAVPHACAALDLALRKPEIFAGGGRPGMHFAWHDGVCCLVYKTFLTVIHDSIPGKTLRP